MPTLTPITEYAELVKEQHALNKTIAPVETDLTGASQAYAKGAKFIYNGIMYQAKTAIAQGAALVLNTNYEAAPDVETQIANEAAVRSQMGAKNLIPNTASSNTNEGVIFTVNSDGTVSTSGASTKNTGNKKSSLTVCNIAVNSNLLGKTLKLSGAPADGSETKWFILVILYDSSEVQLTTVVESGDGIEFTMPSNAAKMSVFLRTHYGVDVTGLVFKPMIRLASDIDNTYQPYAKTNKELTNEVSSQNTAIANEVETRAKLGAHNLLNVKFASKTIGGVAFTVNDDGTISVANGTVSSSAALTCIGSFTLKKGSYIVSLGHNPSDVTNNGSFNIKGHKVNSSTIETITSFVVNNANQASITLSEDYVVTEVYFNINAGMVFANNVKYYPQIRLATDGYSEYTSYVPTNAELLPADTNAVLGAHNLISASISAIKAANTTGSWSGNTYTLGTSPNQISFTVNDDLSVSVSTGSGGAPSGATIILGNKDFGDTLISTYPSYPKEANGYVISGVEYSYNYYVTYQNSTKNTIIGVSQGSILTNKIFYPMIRLASDPSTAYAPYAMTNRELTEVKTGSYTPTVISGGTGTCSGTVIWHRIGKLVFIYASNLAITMTSTNADLVALSLPFDAESNQTIPLYYANSSFFDLSNSVGWVSPVANAFHIMKNGNSVKGSNWGTTAVNIGFAGCYLAK